MGTHPIFESDFDCLTDTPTISELHSFQGNLNELNRENSDDRLGIWTDLKRVNNSFFKSESSDDMISFKDSVEHQYLQFDSVVVSNLEGKLRNTNDKMSASCICKAPSALFKWILLMILIGLMMILISIMRQIIAKRSKVTETSRHDSLESTPTR